MEAGRELDALVAEKVMGADWMREHYPAMMRVGGARLAPFSTDIAAAWRVVEALREKGGCFACFENRYGDSYSGGEWSAYFGVNAEGAMAGAWAGDTECMLYWDNPVPGHVAAKTLPLAICLAALEAVGATP